MSRIRNIWQRPKSTEQKSGEPEIENRQNRFPHQDIQDQRTVSDQVQEDDDFIYEDDESSEEEQDPIQALIEAMRDKSGIEPSLRRRQCISICVNEQDEAVFRASAAKADMTLSAWAREAMYKHAGVRLRRNSKKKKTKKTK